ncbi:MAG: TonB family protein [Tenuifilaceae bacterium]|jgi:TonB family protein|nr:TonB family protein [Tenuifilaceae bacterium]
MDRVNSIFFRFERWLDRVGHEVSLLWDKHKVGFLGTIAINLVITILFFVFELKSRPYLYDPTVLVDFERQYEIAPERIPEEREPLLPKDALDPMTEYEAIQNIAVDATKEDLNPGLIDEKNIDADELYQDAQRIREQMQQNRQLWEEAQTVDADAIPNVQEKIVTTAEEGQFKGPAVISYFLENRRAVRLPVPAYKCENGGRVVVDIEVQRDGTVSRASIDTSNSVIDECMNSAAIAAAQASRFTVSGNAPTRQRGSITYLFVRQ